MTMHRTLIQLAGRDGAHDVAEARLPAPGLAAGQFTSAECGCEQRSAEPGWRRTSRAMRPTKRRVPLCEDSIAARGVPDAKRGHPPFVDLRCQTGVERPFTVRRPTREEPRPRAREAARRVKDVELPRLVAKADALPACGAIGVAPPTETCRRAKRADRSVGVPFRLTRNRPIWTSPRMTIELGSAGGDARPKPEKATATAAMAQTAAPGRRGTVRPSITKGALVSLAFPLKFGHAQTDYCTTALAAFSNWSSRT